jgi:hypothetical protein
MFPKRVRSRNLLRAVAVFALVGVLIGLIPSRTYAATSIDGSYESEMFGFTVEWDTDVWNGEAIPADETTEGVAMDTPLSWGNIRGSAWDRVDEEACVEYMAETFKGGESVKSVKRAPRATELPESELGGEQGLYIMTMDPNEDGDTELAMYLQCVSIADGEAALMVMLIANVSAYESELPNWNALLGGIEPGDGPANVENGNQKSNERESDDGGSYVNDELGFALTWDSAHWTSEALVHDEQQGFELDGELSFGYIAAMPNEGEYTSQECVESIATTMEETDGIKRVRKADDEMTALETADDAYGQLYTALSTDSPTRFALYVDCRPLPGTDYMLLIHLTADASDYEVEVPYWQDLVDSVELIGASVDDARDEDADTESESDADMEQVTGGEFSSANYDFTVSFDDSIWAGESYAEEGYDWLGLTSEYGQVTVIATASEMNMDDCIDTLLEDEYDYATGNIDPASSTYDLPETVDGAAGALFTYEGVDENGGPLDTIAYFECRPIEEGESLIAISYVIAEDVYEETIPELEDLLAGIEVN